MLQQLSHLIFDQDAFLGVVHANVRPAAARPSSSAHRLAGRPTGWLADVPHACEQVSVEELCKWPIQKWYPLEKRSKRSTVSGDVLLNFTFQSEWSQRERERQAKARRQHACRAQLGARVGC